MITADQIVAHLVGDYLLQSDWMAQKKRSSSVAALVHAIVYSLPFLLLPLLIDDGTLLSRFRVDADGNAQAAWVTWQAFAVICGSHFLIDRFGLARYVVWAKNCLAPRWIMSAAGPPEHIPYDGPDPYRRLGGCRQRFRYVRNLPWKSCQKTGYLPDAPPFLAVWLTIIADNVLHILINGAALAWL